MTEKNKCGDCRFFDPSMPLGVMYGRYENPIPYEYGHCNKHGAFTGPYFKFKCFEPKVCDKCGQVIKGRTK
jgi:hypothetical protein